MALLNFRPPVDYESQQSALEGFLQNFKTVPAKNAASAADALMDMNLDDDDLSDDYDFMDDSDDAEQARASRREQREAERLPQKKYMKLLQKIADRIEKEITVELDDLATYENSLQQDDIRLNLVSSIEKNAAHYLDLMAKAIDAVIPEPTRDLTFKDDVLDVIMAQRTNRNQLAAMAAANAADPTVDVQMFPAELTRRYSLNFKPRTSKEDGGPIKALAVRQIKGEHLGNLITVRGITTRVSDVKPSIQVNAYSCDTCGCEIFQPVNSKSFGPMSECPSEDCKVNQSKGQLFPSTRASKFLPFQEVKIQELAEQVPVGHIPRTLTILCHGSLTRRINPGDVIDCAGIFLPTPYTGFKAIRAGLLTDTYLEAQHIAQHKKAYEDMVVDARLFKNLEQYRDSGHIYEFLANSIAPEIYGHLDVKKALLLLLVGGVTKNVGDGMKIRGDINICLMGDPGVAKSQLLKYITKVAPRGVYTTGRGSSGVGLTAAVMKDPVTDEMVLEGGALVLADNGICCIDEFDKMDDSDRTAIHEVMEQQTISISKAGISTSLNARTSILAAANPLYGRYNPRISPVENINLPAALLSRFDVLFLILDTPSRDNDALLAQHVTYVHMNNKHPDPEAGGVVFTPNEVRQYVAQARNFRPTISQSVSDYITGSYVKMRDQQGRDEKAKKHFAHTSPRTLLGIVRLSQALARLRFSEEVVQEDVDEALRLVDVSKASLYNDDSSMRKDASPSSKIYNMVKALAAAGQCTAEDHDDDDDEVVRGEMSMRLLRQRVLAKGFTEDQWTVAIEEYEALDVWQTIAGGTKLIFVTGGGEPNDEDMEDLM